jgi:long-subunit acyl-CoA synthetase (AMP-forming)
MTQVGEPRLAHASGAWVRTLPEAFQETVRLRPDAVALRAFDSEHPDLTWAEYAHRVERIAAGLAALEVAPGDTVGIMLTNRPEFHLVDTAALHLGAVPFSIYNTSSPEQISYLFGNAENWVIVTERQFLGRIKAAGVAYDHLVCVDDPEDFPALTLADVEHNPARFFDFHAAWTAVRPQQLATLIYTSGTTGPPKGVELTHANVIAQLDALTEHIPASFADRVISYLPAAHIADRVVSHYLAMAHGVRVTTLADHAELAAALRRVRPTIFFGVPRVWQKIRAGIETAVRGQRGVRRSLARSALHTAADMARAELDGASRPGLSYRMADRVVLSTLRESLGLDRVRIAASGAAPIPAELLAYFYGLGIAITEVWGMSETTGVTTTTTIEDLRFGTVGKPIAGMEVALAADGELMVRGPMIMRSYRNRPDLTARAIDPAGWLATGDIADVDEDGNIRIIDRKKEMIITGAGKNVSPANVENAVKAASPLIGQVVALGDGMPYLTALVVLDPEAVAAQARALDVEAADLPTLVARPGIREHVIAAVRAGNATLSRPEQIKRFLLLPLAWEPGGDELTPTMKLRRDPIAAKYAPEIAALYAEPPGPDVIDLGADLVPEPAYVGER